MVLAFQTHEGAKTLCQLSHYPAAIHEGDTVTAITEGANAQRISSGVFLRDCVIETP